MRDRIRQPERSEGVILEFQDSVLRFAQDDIR
jgi:hypothetical protein